MTTLQDQLRAVWPHDEGRDVREAAARRIDALEAEVAALRSLRIALNVQHHDCHKAADAFWTYWRENGETHKRGYYESTWGAINAAIRTVGVIPWAAGIAADAAIDAARGKS